MTRCLGAGQHVNLRKSIPGSVRAVRAVRNPGVFQMEIRVVAEEFSSSIGSTASWRNIRQNGELPVLILTVILSTQRPAGTSLIHISFGSSEQPVSLETASVIGLCPHSITSLPAAWYRVMVSFRIL